MSNTIVVYKSRYGSTKKYAEWISKTLGAELSEASNVNAEALKQYDTIIYGGGLYASGILGINLITKSFEQLKNKRLIVFTVGLADPKNEEQFKPLLDKNFNDEMKDTIKVFHLRGAIDYKNLGFIHKSMMAMLKSKVEKTAIEDRDDESNMMLDTYGQVVDFTDEATIKPLIEYCQEIN